MKNAAQCARLACLWTAMDRMGLSGRARAIRCATTGRRVDDAGKCIHLRTQRGDVRPGQTFIKSYARGLVPSGDRPSMPAAGPRQLSMDDPMEQWHLARPLALVLHQIEVMSGIMPPLLDRPTQPGRQHLNPALPAASTCPVCSHSGRRAGLQRRRCQIPG